MNRSRVLMRSSMQNLVIDMLYGLESTSKIQKAPYLANAS